MGRTTYTGLSSPGFIADEGSQLRSNGGRQINWDAVGEWARLSPGQVITLAALAAQGAVALTVDPLEEPVAAGTLLHFGQTGENVRVTTAAAAGAESLAIEAAPVALEDGDAATVVGSGTKRLPAGLVMVEDADGYAVPRRDDAGAGTGGARFILETNADEANRNHALTGYGMLVGAVINENLLPDAEGDPAVLPTAYKTELATNGGFIWTQYSDNRGS